MNPRNLYIILFILLSTISCNLFEAEETIELETATTLPPADTIQQAKEQVKTPGETAVETKNVSPAEIITFAKTLIGVPYKYGSTDPAEGFDCSGFITYVFNHFDIKVPRSSIDFTNVGMPVSQLEAETGDLILFTGTDTLETHVGHMGIVTENTDSLRFIHSTSGKSYGVTITALNSYYLKRFVKVIRIF
ncbi:MAG: NlpC/P60 family protein [Chitinophagaceae bacterium]|nr:MAG: NlpC/P60 family protein [Chitinophagaceae bacterium]